MDPECIEIDPEKNSSKNVDMQSDEVESVDMEGGGKRKRKERSSVWKFFEKDKNAPKGAKKVQSIAVVFDPRYKLHFIEWSYKKIYGESNFQFREVDELLTSTFEEYVMLNVDNGSFTTSNPASSSSASKVEKSSDDTSRFYGVKAKLLDFDEFQSTEFVTNKKSELELYLEEPRMERTMELDVLVFWKANQFRYPILARMARDFLTIPISTVASESTFSASGRVLDKHRSSLAKDTVEALICTKDWLYADSDIDLDQLTEDIMSLDVNAESDASNSVDISDPPKV